MATVLTDLLGEDILQHGEPSQVPTAELDGKTVALYFSAHWCGPCCYFTPKLAENFQKLHAEIKDKLDIVFVSLDQNQESFDEYYKDMPWKALPYSDRVRSKALKEKFGVAIIPSLVVLTPSGTVLTTDGVEELRAVAEEPLRLWLQGKRLFWTSPANEGEHVWAGTLCTVCYMYPMVGNRRGCSHRECNFNVCDACFLKNTHEHPLLEYIIPKKSYTLAEIFASVPYLLDPKSEEHIPTESLWKDGAKSIGIYFSIQCCSPELDIASRLIEYYNEAKVSENPFPLVFLSYDSDEATFNKYRATMPWPAIPFNFERVLSVYYEFPDTASLVVISADGKSITSRGHNYVVCKGAEAVKLWAKGETVPALTPEEFEWDNTYCNGCSIGPLIGLRYYCSTCGNFDLCSTCEKKGHEHPLQLISPPEEELSG